jgi:hypothetical protein
MKKVHLSTFVLLGLCSILSASAESRFVSLFNGVNLDGWSCPEMGYWRVENGAIVAQSTAENPCRKNQFLVWQLGDIDNFHLMLKYKIEGSDNANSGIQFRSFVQPDGHATGYQADMDRAMNWAGTIYDEHTGRKMLAKRGQKTVIDQAGKRTVTSLDKADALTKKINKDDWNEYEVIAIDESLTLKINGTVMCEVEDRETAHRDLIGKLALQIHSGPPMKVSFKDIQLKRLPREDGRKKVVLIAGKPSHRAGDHEHNAGCLLFSKCLNESVSDRILPVVYHNGWPADPTAFDEADAVIFYCDGWHRHMALPHLESFDKVMAGGVGLGCVHFGVEVPPENGGPYFLRWIGGFYEAEYSVNPHWKANFTSLTKHPITRGVKPYAIDDEWYFNMRFPKEMKGVIPILTAIPPKGLLPEKNHHHNSNAIARKMVAESSPQHMMWATERPDGGRGFGFTGGHFHKNWGNENQRKIVLNAILWATGAEVPETGVSSTVTEEDLAKNLDQKPVRKKKPKKK